MKFRASLAEHYFIKLCTSDALEFKNISIIIRIMFPIAKKIRTMEPLNMQTESRDEIMS